MGIEHRPEGALVVGIRMERTREYIEERDVMVARNRQHLRRRELIRERARGRELRASGALRDVARQHDDLRRDLSREIEQRGYNRRLFSSEVGVGNLQQHAQGATSSGVININGCGATENRKSVRVAGNMECNSIEALKLAALHGQGLILVPSFLVDEEIKSGRLIPVLTQFPCAEKPINAVYPHRHHLSAKVRSFLELVTRHFRVVEKSAEELDRSAA